jgi:flavodoxin
MLARRIINMKVIVAYMSQTGNTRKVAEAIFEEIQSEKELKALDELDSLRGYDLAFIGFPIQIYGPAQPAKVFLEEHAAGKDIVLFTTHASPEDDKMLLQWLDACRAAAVGGNVVGLFHCRGELSEKVADMMKSSGDSDLVAWAEKRSETLGQPDATRLKRARAFARETMRNYAV